MLNPKNFGVAIGIVCGLSAFIITWISIMTGHATLWLTLMEDAYPGYHISPLGSIVGLIYGLIKGFIWGGSVSWLYNRLNRMC